MNLHNFRRVITLVFVFLTCALSTAHAQTVSVPFPTGFIGTVGTSSNKADNILTFQTLGIVRGEFIQASTNGQFGGTQGNDLSGTVRLVLTNGSTIDIPGAINWRVANGGTLNAIGFIPNPGNQATTIPYGNGLQFALNSTRNYGLQFATSNLVFSDGTNITGNAGTSNVLAALNAYLATVAANGPKITGPTGGVGAAASATTVNENQTAATTLTADRTVTWSIVGGSDAARFAINSTTGVLTFLAPPDFEVPTDSDVNNTYLVTVRAIDANGYPGQQTVTVTVANLDDSAPLILGASGLAGDASSAKSVPENQTAVHTFTANETVTWSITGGADAARFSIVPATGILTFNASPDFELPTDVGANNVYNLAITATDGSNNASTQAVAITVTDVDEVAPVITGPSDGAGAASSAKSVPENQTAVHTFAASESVTWSISGADAARFVISSAGVITFVTAPDFEVPTDVGADNIYDLIVTATDPAANASVQTVAITVTDVDDTIPVITGPTNAPGAASSAKSVPENQTAVHTFAASESVTWSISGADAARFVISSAGVLTFVTAPDFEVPTDAGVDNIYDLIVTATDPAGNASAQAAAITVTDIDESTPVITGPTGAAGALSSAQSINEGIQAVHSFTASETVIWTISGGADAARFAINATSGAISLISVPDFELPTDAGSNNVYDVTIVATDAAGNFAAQTVAVTILDLDENAPLITGPSGAAGAVTSVKSVIEGTLPVHTFMANEAVVWAIAGGADGLVFSVDPLSGALSFVAGPDFEAPGDANVDNVYLVVVSATDGSGNVSQQGVSVTVTDAPEDTTPPVITGPSDGAGALTSAKTVDEGTTAVHNFTANEGVVWALNGGADAGRFTINATSGALSFNLVPDYEAPTDSNTDNVYIVIVSGTDGFGNTSQQNVTVTVADLLEDATPPVITGPEGNGNNQAETVPEGLTEVFDFSANEPVTWALGGGADAGLFAIDQSGVLTFLTAPDFAAPADADGNNVYLVTVRATDAAGNLTTLTLSVTVTDTTAPAITGPSGTAGDATSSRTVNEGTVAVHTFTANETVTWTLTGGEDEALFAIDPSTGALTFLTAPDFEAPTDTGANNVYLVRVTATDGAGNTSDQSVTVTVADVADTDITPPILGGPQTISVNENQTAVDTYTADEDVVWSISVSVDGARFLIDPATGVLTFATAPDYETPTDAGTNNVYDVVLTATDAAGNATNRTVAVTVANLAEDTTSPVVSGPQGNGTSQSLTVPDEQTAVATLTANEAVTWAISGGADAGDFVFDPATGVLRFASPPDFAAPTDADGNNVYVVVIRATDSAGNTTDVTLQITVADPTTPVITGPSGLPGAAASTTTVIEGTATVAQFTANRPLIWSLGGGSDAALFQIDPNTGALSFITAPDFDLPKDSDGNNVYVAIVEGTDENGATTSQTVTIIVTNLADTPSEVAVAGWDDAAQIIADVELNHLRAGIASRQSMVRSARDRFIEAGKLRQDCRDLEALPINTPQDQNNPCDVLAFNTVPFDVDGWIDAGVNGLNGAGMFFGQTGSADGVRRRIISGEFQFVDDGSGVGTAEINGRVAWERLISDRLMLGYFVEGGLARSTVDRGFQGDVNKTSLAFGAYVVAEPVSDLYLDGFASLGFGRNDFAFANDDLSLAGGYSSQSFLIGGSMSGVIKRDGFEIRPELALAFGRTNIGTVNVAAVSSGGAADLLEQIDGVTYATVSLTPEIIIPFDFSGVASELTFAPSFICEWAEGDQSCGGGLELGLRGQTDDGLTSYNLTLDADRIAGVSRAGLTISLEVRF